MVSLYQICNFSAYAGLNLHVGPMHDVEEEASIGMVIDFASRERYAYLGVVTQASRSR